MHQDFPWNAGFHSPWHSGSEKSGLHRCEPIGARNPRSIFNTCGLEIIVEWWIWVCKNVHWLKLWFLCFLGSLVATFMPPLPLFFFCMLSALFLLLSHFLSPHTLFWPQIWPYLYRAIRVPPTLPGNIESSWCLSSFPIPFHGWVDCRLERLWIHYQMCSAPRSSAFCFGVFHFSFWRI